MDAYHDVLKLKLNDGRGKLKKIIPAQDQLSHYLYVSSLADAIEIVVSEDASLYKQYEDHEDEYLKRLRELDDIDPHKKYYESEIRIQWAVVKIIFGDNLKAGWSLKSAYSQIEKNIEEFPKFISNYKAMGMLHILFAIVPETYHWVLKFYGIKANAILGWKELSKIEKNNPYTLEVGLIQTMIALNIINRQDLAEQMLNNLLVLQQDNLMVNYLHNVVLMKYAKSEKALPKLKQLVYVGSEYYPIYNIHYKLGIIYLQKQHYPMARYYFSKFLNLHKGKNYIKDSWYKVFLSYWLEGNEKMAEIHWKKAQKAGAIFTAADKNANQALIKDEYPHPDLIRARLATDGGYFNQAFQILEDIHQETIETKEEETEYFYRYGRLFHLKGKEEKAIFNYLNAIKKAGEKNWYFAPSACLYTGYIYEERGDLKKAEFYYHKVLSYKRYHYKTGIDYKANAAIQWLK